MKTKKMTSQFTIPNQLQGRDIFSRVIPTVSSLNNLCNKLDQIDWDYSELKSWEKTSFNAYNLDNIKAELKQSDDKDRSKIIKSNLLQINAHNLGPHPICIYLVAYFIQLKKSTDLGVFKKFVIDNGISNREASASAIWSVGTNDGKFLNLFDSRLNIIELDFFEKWSKVVIDKPQQKSPIITSKKAVKQLHVSNNTNHLEFFLSIEENTKWIGGANSYDWSKYVLKSNKSKLLNTNLDHKFYRDELLSYCSNKENSDLDCLLAILSWGGMHREHGRKLFENSTTVLDITNKLRNNCFSNRKEAYAYIRNQRSKKLLPGLGIGYYTKLICFLAPNLNGYIMDQWLAKSINLITGSNKIKMNSKSWVTDVNDEATYDSFCQEIEKIAILLGVSGFKAEEKLFSIGGKTKGQWREYLINNYNNI